MYEYRHNGAGEYGEGRDLRGERLAREEAEAEAAVSDGGPQRLLVRALLDDDTAVHNLVQVERLVGARPARAHTTGSRLPIVVPHPNRHCSYKVQIRVRVRSPYALTRTRSTEQSAFTISTKK